MKRWTCEKCGHELALAAELDKQAIVGMGVKDIAKRLRGIAG